MRLIKNKLATPKERELNKFSRVINSPTSKQKVYSNGKLYKKKICTNYG